MVRLQGCSQLSVEENVLASHLSVSVSLAIVSQLVSTLYTIIVCLYNLHTQISQDTEISITL